MGTGILHRLEGGCGGCGTDDHSTAVGQASLNKPAIRELFSALAWHVGFASPINCTVA